ncbi:MAG: carboxypeptidase regulatory-like domain-containing protein, partial [Acidobacteria bacterium]|nr:carboxypeptidase regulatory-like domain-containing protein [Acidobacteriota bacterium]
MRKVTTLISCAGLLLLSSVAAFGQAVYGNIVGTVTDPQSAAVANATVTITDTARQTSVTTATNDDGNFTQRGLIAGEYQIRIEASGFKAAVQNVTVSVDQETRAELKLEVGNVSEVVEISSGGPLLKTDRADVAVTFSEKTVTNLPIINRRFTQFELLTPGVQATTSQTASSEDPQGSFRKVVNGQSFAGTTQLLDGTDNHDALLGLIVINPTLESLSEAKLTTASYDAEFGATAGVISVQTKSGAND